MSIRQTISVCLVDDDEDYFIITRDIFAGIRSFSIDLRWYSTYDQAIEGLATQTFDLCLMDYQLGTHTGVELLRELGKTGHRFPVIILTSLGDHEVDLEVMKHGAADYLIKGQIDPALLERVVRYTLERHRTMNELRRSHDSLNNTKTQLEDALKRINEELETAKKVQKSLLPKKINIIPGVEIEAIYLPSGSVGGDLYDVVALPEDRFALLMFDVCGHGVPAALISAMAKVSFTRYIETIDSCADILRLVNQELCAFMPDGRFLTAFLGILDLSQNSFTFSQGGHPASVHYKQATGSVNFLSSKGTFIGLSPSAVYEENVVFVEPGDALVLYTDGLIESSSADGAFFGKAGLETAVIDAMIFPKPRVLATIMDEWATFTRNIPQHDDLTVMTLRFLHKKNDSHP